MQLAIIAIIERELKQPKKILRVRKLSFSKVTPLKIRGAGGVMKVTPCTPLTLRGRLKEDPIRIKRGY